MRPWVFMLPDLGEGLIDAVVLEWLVEVGDEVARDAPLVEIETTKASVVLPAPAAGRVVQRHAEVGERLEVGAPLISLGIEEQAGIIGAIPQRREQTRTVRLRRAASYR